MARHCIRIGIGCMHPLRFDGPSSYGGNANPLANAYTGGKASDLTLSFTLSGAEGRRDPASPLLRPKISDDTHLTARVRRIHTVTHDKSPAET